MGGCHGCGGIPIANPYPSPLPVQPLNGGVSAVAPISPRPFTPGYAVGGIVDADPITPGIQARPGVVTPVGPSRITSGPVLRGPTPVYGGVRPF